MHERFGKEVMFQKKRKTRAKKLVLASSLFTVWAFQEQSRSLLRRTRKEYTDSLGKERSYSTKSSVARTDKVRMSSSQIGKDWSTDRGGEWCWYFIWILHPSHEGEGAIKGPLLLGSDPSHRPSLGTLTAFILAQTPVRSASTCYSIILYPSPSGLMCTRLTAPLPSHASRQTPRKCCI